MTCRFCGRSFDIPVRRPIRLPVLGSAVECVPEELGSVLLDLTVETVWEDDTAIVRCRGRILHGDTAGHLRARVTRLIVRHRRVVLDLEGVTQLDACGVGTLAALVSLARGPHGTLVLAAPPGRVRRLLQLTRLDTQVEFVTFDELCSGSSEGVDPDLIRGGVSGQRTGQ